MKTTTYECNLCHEELTPEQAIGLYYDNYWVIDDPENCTEHICHDCLEQMAMLSKERDNDQN
jgi:hypothetical protein